MTVVRNNLLSDTNIRDLQVFENTVVFCDRRSGHSLRYAVSIDFADSFRGHCTLFLSLQPTGFMCPIPLLDERTSSPVSPGLGRFLVSWFLGLILVFLAPSIGKSRRLGCQYLGHLGLKYLSSLQFSFSNCQFGSSISVPAHHFWHDQPLRPVFEGLPYTICVSTTVCFCPCGEDARKMARVCSGCFTIY